MAIRGKYERIVRSAQLAMTAHLHDWMLSMVEGARQVALSGAELDRITEDLSPAPGARALDPDSARAARLTFDTHHTGEA